MNLFELATYDVKAANNSPGSKIPWNDVDFSRRMLENHLSQEHDWASRRKNIIAQHTAWITNQIKPTSRILDLGCGLGFYMQALAELGHHRIGVDFSPASIEYAKKQAVDSGLALEYFLRDIREYRTDEPFACIIMTFGEFNVFTRKDATLILKNCSKMLAANGMLILEAHTYEAVVAVEAAPATWQRHVSGLFSDMPHLYLQENNWNSEESSALSRYYIVDAASAEVRQYASFMQAYSVDEYKEMLRATGMLTEKILADTEWPCGPDFQDKLKVFACRKV